MYFGFLLSVLIHDPKSEVMHNASYCGMGIGSDCAYSSVKIFENFWKQPI